MSRTHKRVGYAAVVAWLAFMLVGAVFTAKDANAATYTPAPPAPVGLRMMLEANDYQPTAGGWDRFLVLDA